MPILIRQILCLSATALFTIATQAETRFTVIDKDADDPNYYMVLDKSSIVRQVTAEKTKTKKDLVQFNLLTRGIGIILPDDTSNPDTENQNDFDETYLKITVQMACNQKLGSTFKVLYFDQMSNGKNRHYDDGSLLASDFVDDSDPILHQLSQLVCTPK